MKKLQKAGFFWLLLILCTVRGFGVDFGVSLSAEPEYASGGPAEPGFAITGRLSPWLSALFAPTLSFYVSGRVSLEYDQGELEPVLFELDRIELAWRPASSVYLEFGRQRYSDDAGLIAAGLFDGAYGSVSLGAVRLSLGAFYTGLLYKDQSKILMTLKDREQYSRKLDYNDPDSYFASRRIVVPISAELGNLTDRSSLVLNGLAQFDMNRAEADDTRHSQYLEINYLVEPWEPLHLSVTAIAGLSEEEKLHMGFAASAGADWELPGAVQDLLSLGVLWSSGKVNDFIGAYTPVTGIVGGKIFTPRLTGLMYAGTSYTIRPHQTLSAEAGAGYFIRTDLETFDDTELDLLSSSRFLGGEIYGSVIWAPQSAFMVTLGSGAFFPGWGGAFVSDADIRWKVTLGMTVSF